MGVRSIIYMDVGEKQNEAAPDLIKPIESENAQNLSFSEPIVGHEHNNHYKREEFYTKNLYHDSNKSNSTNEIDSNDELVNDTYQNSQQANMHKMSITPSDDKQAWVIMKKKLNFFWIAIINTDS